MFLDQRGGWLEKARYYLQAAAYPLQLAVSSPSAAWRWLEDSFETRASLREENEALRVRQRDLAVRSMRYEALALENAQLRGLKEALPPVAERWLVAEVMNVELNSLRQRVLINRGANNGVFKGQAILDDNGVIGQTTHVGPWSAEVILITDPEHAVPVQIERTGLRTIAVGAGAVGSLALPYLPGNADVKQGDLLITSGLGGVFPAGYPVGRIAAVHREAVQPLAQVLVEPLGRIDLEREVTLVWFRESHPAAPAPAEAGDLRIGNPALQPQLVPPAPAPVAPPVQPGGAAVPNTMRPATGAPVTNTRPAGAAAPANPGAGAPTNNARPAGTTAPANPGIGAPTSNTRPAGAAAPVNPGTGASTNNSGTAAPARPNTGAPASPGPASSSPPTNNARPNAPPPANTAPAAPNVSQPAEPGTQGGTPPQPEGGA